MSTLWLVSDTHFGHESVCTKFKNPDGSPLRDFPNAEEMNEELVKRWNDRVRPDDRVYHLGDVVMSHRHLPIMDRLNGRKVLIQGNHDPIGGKKGAKFDFAKYFEYVCGMKVLDDYILTHIPIHPDDIGRFGANIHGHLHGTQRMWKVRRQADYTIDPEAFFDEPDPRYLCVSIEQTNLAPIDFDEAQARIMDRQQKAGYTPAKAWGNGSGPS
jgi:calcineurin-like phosphoesterase family protein